MPPPITRDIGSEENVLIADNLNVHTTPDFKTWCRQKASTLVWLLPANMTHILQPIDAGYGAWIKRITRGIIEQYLSTGDAAKRASVSAVPAWERRVLITHAVSKATHFAGNNYNVKALFIKTGHAMTVDGTRDDLVKPQHLSGYTFSREGGAGAGDP